MNNVKKFDEFFGDKVFESASNNVKTYMNVFVSCGWDNTLTRFKMNGLMDEAQNLARHLAKQIENYVNKGVKMIFKDSEQFFFNENNSDLNNVRLEFTSKTSYYNYDLKKQIHKFFDGIAKGNRDKTASISINLVTIDDDGKRHIVKYNDQYQNKAEDMEWEDFKGTL